MNQLASRSGVSRSKLLRAAFHAVEQESPARIQERVLNLTLARAEEPGG